MLIEFTVGNYRSFQEPQTLSLVAAKLKSKDKQLDENNIIPIPNNPSVLVSAAIYGANASGKSNFVRALHFMRSFVLDSPRETKATGAIEVERFRLSTETKGEPSLFEIVFVVSGKRYRYGFEVTTERVEAEWLYVVPTSREARLFERVRDEIVIGKRFREGRDIGEHTRPNALFLSVVAQFNGPTAQNLLTWFRHMEITSSLTDIGMTVYTLRKLLNGEYVSEINQLIQRLDLGIAELQVEKGPNVPPQFSKEMPEDVQEALRTLVDRPGAEKIHVRTVHKLYDDSHQPKGDVLLEMNEHESDGTQKLFALSGLLINTLQNGQVLIIDELDARLHPLLTREIVSLFNNRTTNPNGAQLVFTTQDTNLLDNTLFRRDQIWFVEKESQGASHLYSLAEFRVRYDKSYERGYIQGRFGAIPYLSNQQTIVSNIHAQEA